MTSPITVGAAAPVSTSVAAATGFAATGLSHKILAVLEGKGHDTPTPIQAQAIPALLEGRDLLGLAQTGTGKTNAFALPLLHHLSASRAVTKPGTTRALILAPTRELALQIADAIAPYAKTLKLRFAVVMGGVSRYVQTQVMKQGLDVLIATPGRLMDLIRDKDAHLAGVTHFVIDEADRMLDMGFIRDVQTISRLLPKDVQSALFSATMPKEIEHLAQALLKEPVRVQVQAKTVAVSAIRQEVRMVSQPNKMALLRSLLGDASLEKVVVFARTKYGADKMMKQLEASGVNVRAIHGNKSQGQRQAALQAFRDGKARVLLATDIAARGIDVPGISHVINFDLPMDAENYVHRIGRTARAGSAGVAISFCDGSERSLLSAIEKLLKQKIVVNGDVPLAPPLPEMPREAATERRRDERRPERREKREYAPRPPREADARSPRAPRPERSEGDFRPARGTRWKPETGPADRSDRRGDDRRPQAARPDDRRPSATRPDDRRPQAERPDDRRGARPAAAPGGKPRFGGKPGGMSRPGTAAKPAGNAGRRFSGGGQGGQGRRAS